VVSPGRSADLFELVLICTGNRARSPIAEGYLRQLLADLPVYVHSLGTLELEGAPPLPEALEAAAQAGLDLSAHRSRALGGQDLSQADLVLGFELSHLAAAVVDGRAARERVFSLPELAELIDRSGTSRETDPIRRAREVIATANALRVTGAAPAELADPIGQSPSFHRETVERVRDLSVRLAVGLFGRESVRPLSPGTAGSSSRA
jgi:protein-tyrosine phosphatase